MGTIFFEIEFIFRVHIWNLFVAVHSGNQSDFVYYPKKQIWFSKDDAPKNFNKSLIIILRELIESMRDILIKVNDQGSMIMHEILTLHK